MYFRFDNEYKFNRLDFPHEIFDKIRLKFIIEKIGKGSIGGILMLVFYYLFIKHTEEMVQASQSISSIMSAITWMLVAAAGVIFSVTILIRTLRTNKLKGLYTYMVLTMDDFDEYISQYLHANNKTLQFRNVLNKKTTDHLHNMSDTARAMLEVRDLIRDREMSVEEASVFIAQNLNLYGFKIKTKRGNLND